MPESLFRSAKSGSDWVHGDLCSYNITVSNISQKDFFPQGARPSLRGLLDPAILNFPLNATDVSDDTFRFFTHLDLATRAFQESAIDNFAQELLNVVGFVERGTAVLTHHIIPLMVCGDLNRVAETDVCLIDRDTRILLVLQEDKSLFNRSDPEAQVIAEAIAAYQYNNHRRKLKGLSELNVMTVPCITMIGTRPTFYLVPVTRQLSEAVRAGQWPKFETKVLKCAAASIPGRKRRLSEGMQSPDYRRIDLKCMTAFKTLAKYHWKKFLEN